MMARALLVSTLALLHLAVALLLLQPPPQAARPVVPTMMIVAIPESPTTIEAPPPVTVERFADVEAPMFDIAPSRQTIAAGPCALTEDVQMALQQDAAVDSAIGHIPAAARSVSNALLIWDGRWAMPGSIGGDAALRPIQTLVQARIRAAPVTCQAEALTGPRLMIMPHAGGVIVLAFGSGVWRWDQLLL